MTEPIVEFQTLENTRIRYGPLNKAAGSSSSSSHPTLISGAYCFQDKSSGRWTIYITVHEFKYLVHFWFKGYTTVKSRVLARLMLMLAFSDCLWRVNLMFIHCDFLGKSWFPYYKHTLVLETLWYIKLNVRILLKLLQSELWYSSYTDFNVSQWNKGTSKR